MINVAIIGAGIGREHLRGYLSLPESFCVRYLCDLDTERAEEVICDAAGAAPSIAVSSAIDDVLADRDVHLVDVCLPPHLHFTVVRDALSAGKHVVVEKPMVASLAEADALIDEAERAGRIVSPVFQYRFGPAMSQLQALQAAGLTGRAFAASLETHWNRGEDYYAVPWRGTWAGENGGAVLGHAIHNHDLLTSILGPVSSLSAFTTTRVNEIETEDCAAISFQMESGAVATSSITLGAATDTTRIRIAFERLTAESGSAPYAPASDTWVFTARDPADQSKVDDVLASVGDVRSVFAEYFAELARQISGEGHRAVTIQDGRRSIELVAAIYQAARDGGTIRLPLDNSAPLYSGWAPDTHNSNQAKEISQ